MSKSDAQLVVFDLGGVLVRIARGWPDVFHRTGLDEDPGIVDNLDKITAINNQFESGFITEPQLIAGVVRFAQRCNSGHIEAMLDAWLVEPYAGIVELIECVGKAGATTACLSNTNPRHWRIMMETDHRYAPLRSLNHRIASHLIRVMKPHEGAYSAVEKQTGFDAKRIIFFDDNADNIAAANRRGWRTCRIDPMNDPPRQMREHLVHLGVI